MRLSRRTLLGAVLVVAIVAAWTLLRPGAFEVASLRTFDDQGDAFAHVWVVDDAESDFVWLRANRSDRLWLERVRANPKVVLRRDGRSGSYLARVFDDDVARGYVAGGFRDKYGPADVFRELFQGSDTVPVRLRPR